MGKIIRFDPRRRRKRAWTRASDYGVRPAPRPPRFDAGGRKRRARRHVGFGWALLLAAILAWIAWDSRALWGPAPDPEATTAQVVEAKWARCDAGGPPARHCVVDGDTFRIGRESYRLTRFDTPEKEARCAGERVLAEEATEALRAWLDAGPFVMRGEAGDATDGYGRRLREVFRMTGGGTRDRAGDALIAQGLARPYSGGARQDWCTP